MPDKLLHPVAVVVYPIIVDPNRVEDDEYVKRCVEFVRQSFEDVMKNLADEMARIAKS